MSTGDVWRRAWAAGTQESGQRGRRKLFSAVAPGRLQKVVGTPQTEAGILVRAVGLPGRLDTDSPLLTTTIPSSLSPSLPSSPAEAALRYA